MKLTYTGRQVELAPAQLRKIEVQFAKLSKLLDGKEQCEAHIILAQERHLNKAEVTLNYHDHPLVGVGSSNDLFTAIHSAIDKLEKQAIKVRAKWRDTKRTPQKSIRAARPETERLPESDIARKVFRVNHHQRRKPMTLDEAMLEMEKDREYLVYRDAESDRISVLVRRRDGHFDLVEA
ncbi:MAG: ribosome hibernation-promoting factor, HPF/YfiA family [Bryobacteraceae bacterium]